MKKLFYSSVKKARRAFGLILVMLFVTAIQPPAAQAIPSETILAAAYGAYHEILRSAVDAYGIGTSDSKNYLDGPDIYCPQGVLFAALIDFDNDGLPELLSIFMDGDWPSLYGQFWAVYGYSANADLYFKQLEAAEGGSSSAYGIVTDRNGISYLHEIFTDYVEDDAGKATDYYYTVKSGKWVEVPGTGLDIVSTYQMYGGTDSVYAVLSELQSLQTAALSAERPALWAEGDVNAAIAAGLVPEDLQSKYTQATTRSEFCALAVTLYETVTGKQITAFVAFTDTNDVNVQKAAAIGIVNGVGNNQFNPDGKLTREQAATMLSRLADAVGRPLPKQSAVFNDIDSVAPYAMEAVGQMQASGIMGGIGDNTFSPKTDYQRQQSIVTILRLFIQMK